MKLLKIILTIILLLIVFSLSAYIPRTHLKPEPQRIVTSTIPLALSQKYSGFLKIPADNGPKYLRTIIDINRREIKFKFREKVYREFNDFGSPFTNSFTIKCKDIEELHFKSGKVYITPKKSIMNRYRNFLSIGHKLGGVFLPGPLDETVFFFCVTSKEIDFRGIITDTGIFSKVVIEDIIVKK